MRRSKIKFIVYIILFLIILLINWNFSDYSYLRVIISQNHLETPDDVYHYIIENTPSTREKKTEACLYCSPQFLIDEDLAFLAMKVLFLLLTSPIYSATKLDSLISSTKMGLRVIPWLKYFKTILGSVMITFLKSRTQHIRRIWISIFRMLNTEASPIGIIKSSIISMG